MRRLPIRTLVPVALAVLCAVALQPGLAAAQDATDVYFAKLVQDGDAVRVEAVENLTDRDGYDNQPSFSADGATLFYTSIRDGQSDIWAVAPGAGRHWQVTDTPESEYSPTQIPGEDALSVVRVEEDGTQRLWRFPLDGGRAGEPSLVLETIRPVGYHAWSAEGDELVLFVLGEPMQLVRVAADDAEAPGREVAADIGRALHAIPGENAFSFVHKDGEESAWTIRRIEIGSDEITTLFLAFPGREDLTWSPDGWAWMADGMVLHRRRPGDDDWQQVANLSGQLPGDITRLAISPDGQSLALVSNRSAPEPESAD